MEDKDYVATIEIRTQASNLKEAKKFMKEFVLKNNFGLGGGRWVEADLIEVKEDPIV